MRGKERGTEIRRSVVEEPHNPAKSTPLDEASRILGTEGEREIQPTALDLKKMKAYNLALSEMFFGIPPALFTHIKYYKRAKEILDLLQDLLKRSKNVKEKRLILWSTITIHSPHFLVKQYTQQQIAYVFASIISLIMM